MLEGSFWVGGLGLVVWCRVWIWVGMAFCWLARVFSGWSVPGPITVLEWYFVSC